MSAFPHVDASHYGYQKHQEHQTVANTLNDLLNAQIEKAMDTVSELLGFNPFTRELDDYKAAYGLVVPDFLFNDNRDLCDALVSYVTAVFKTHYITLEHTVWRTPTTYKDLDCCGSRSRDVDVPQHFYFEPCLRSVGTRRPPLDYCDMEKFPVSWDIDMNTDDQCHFYVRVCTTDGDVAPWKAADGAVVAEPGNAHWDEKHNGYDCDCGDSDCESE